MSKSARLIGLDVGTVRIGVALGDTNVRIAVPDEAIDVDGSEVLKVAEVVLKNDITTIVIGYPRNQSGDTTKQTEIVEHFAEQLRDIDAEIVFQDESLTSVEAEERLTRRGQPFTKADIDNEAAVIILQDYMEQRL